jgi:hypothetical protein
MPDLVKKHTGMQNDAEEPASRNGVKILHGGN